MTQSQLVMKRNDQTWVIFTMRPWRGESDCADVSESPKKKRRSGKSPVRLEGCCQPSVLIVGEGTELLAGEFG